MSNNYPKKYALLDFLAGDGAYGQNTLTVAQARARFRIENVSARVNELRREGFAIYTNTKTLNNGRTIRFYRLGNPSERFERNFNAGRTKIAIRSLYRKSA